MPETAIAFLLFYAVGLMLTLFVKPVYGLYTYVAVFYLHPPSRWWGGELPDLRWSLIVAAVTFVAIFVHRKQDALQDRWTSSTIAKVLILYTAWMWIQLPWVPSPYHLDGAILFTKYVLLIYIMYELIDGEKEFTNFCLAHVLGCAYLGWLVYLAPDTGRLESVGGPGIHNANTLGMHLATGVMFAAFLLLANKGWRRWIILVAIPFILNGIIQTETRGALVGFFFGGVITIFLKPKKYRRSFYTLAVIGLVGFIGLANEAFVGRMTTMTAAVDEEKEWDTSAQNRLQLLDAQLRMFSDFPLGAGHQGTAWLSTGYMEDRWLASNSGDRASHNTVMSVLVDQGAPGIILMGILGCAVYRTLRELKALDSAGLRDTYGLYRAMIGGALCTAIISGMFAQYLKAEIQIWCLALLAILFKLSNASEPSK